MARRCSRHPRVCLKIHTITPTTMDKPLSIVAIQAPSWSKLGSGTLFMPHNLPARPAMRPWASAEPGDVEDVEDVDALLVIEHEVGHEPPASLEGPQLCTS